MPTLDKVKTALECVRYSSDKPETVSPYRAWQQVLRELAGNHLTPKDQRTFDRRLEGFSKSAASVLIEAELVTLDQLVAVATLLFAHNLEG